jgi:hypothetical protein
MIKMGVQMLSKCLGHLVLKLNKEENVEFVLE